MIPLQLWVHYEREFSKKRELILQQHSQQEEIQKEIQQKQEEKTQSVDRKDSQQDIKNEDNKNNKFTNPLRNFWT